MKAEYFLESWPFAPHEIVNYLTMQYYRESRKTPQEREEDNATRLLDEVRELYKQVIHFKVSNDQVRFDASQNIADILELRSNIR